MAGSGWGPPRLEGFILTERLGSGTYATVYKAYAKKDTREVVAIKCVAKKSLNKASVENLLTEIEILKGIRHPHIVQLKDFQVWTCGGATPKEGWRKDPLSKPPLCLSSQWDSDNIYLIMEFCAGGDLSRFIHTRRILPEKVARVFMQQLAPPATPALPGLPGPAAATPGAGPQPPHLLPGFFCPPLGGPGAHA
uniref:non-specific serine/threonine protein kinase n=1 Tax=Sus scrofa TaxID=9823 RepID=A0A8D0PD57_PIG